MKKLIIRKSLWKIVIVIMVPFGFVIYFYYFGLWIFTYKKTYTLDIGSEGDTKISRYYLGLSPNLSDPKKDQNGSSYRELSGEANIYFKPNINLKKVNLKLDLDGDNVEIIRPWFDISLDKINWDQDWKFKNLPNEFINHNNEAFYFDGAIYFSGQAYLELKNSSDKFKSGPLAIYIEWTPINDQANSQQIVGHSNWALVQDKEKVHFWFGDNDRTYTITYDIKEKENFFHQKNQALINYNTYGNGYLELYINKNFVKRINLNGYRICPDCNKEKNLLLGKSESDNDPLFQGAIHQISFKKENITTTTKELELEIDSLDEFVFKVWSNTTAKLRQAKLIIKRTVAK